MRRFRFPIAVAITSLALVGVVAAFAVLVAPSALASAVWTGGVPFGPRAVGLGAGLPPEMQGLLNLPPSERFSHFVGAHVDLKDQNGQPLTIDVTPGTVTSSSSSGLVIAANDGSTKTFTLNDQTAIHGKPAGSNATPTSASLANGDQVVVVTLNGDTAARAVVDGGKDGFSTGWSGGPRGWGHWATPSR